MKPYVAGPLISASERTLNRLPKHDRQPNAYNQMLAQVGDDPPRPPLAPMSRLVADVLDALRRLEEGSA
jgi:hypothetical protein